MKLIKNLSSISKKCMLCFSTLATVFLSSCKDDDDDKKLSDDPRIRKVTISNFSDYEFVVNDAEGIIFNYDSLPYGTKVDSLIPYIYGYASTDLLIGVKDEGSENFSLYANNTALDLSKPVTLVTTSEDLKHDKTYTFDLRVHKYDVDAFDWEQVATLDLSADTIYSEKSIVYDDIYTWFVRTNSGSWVFKSTDGITWSKTEVNSPSDLNFDNLVLCGDTLFATTIDNQVVKTLVSASNFEATSLDSVSSVERMLFSLDKKLWFIKDGCICSYADGKIISQIKMPSDFSKSLGDGEFKTFAAASGYTTLGYVYSSSDNGGVVWSIDRYGNVVCLSKDVLPSCLSPIVFSYGEILGLIGGYNLDGKLNNKCYSSKNCGLTWTGDWHKDFSEHVGAIAQSGIFVTSEKGEMLLVSGVTNDGVSLKVMAGRLRLLKQNEDFFNSLK